MTIKITSIIGARPQFIKASTLSRQFRKHPRFCETIIHSGQHFDPTMSEIFFKELNIPQPAYNLGVHGRAHGEMIGQILEKTEKILLKDRPDLVVIYGDTNTTLAGGLAATKLHIPIAHIEAGMRSFNKSMPEEINRIVTDHIADLHFCATSSAVKNLANEGVKKNVFHVGDVMLDAAMHFKEKSASASTILDQLSLTSGQYNVCTIHRAENTDTKAQLQCLISYLGTQNSDLPMVFLVHPRTKLALKQYAIACDNLLKIDPLGYFDLSMLVSQANTIFTDSGGLQKEAYFHSVPCVTLRQETEWNETIQAGWNRLWHDKEYKLPRTNIPDFGDGNAAELIVEHIENFFNSQRKIGNYNTVR